MTTRLQFAAIRFLERHNLPRPENMDPEAAVIDYIGGLPDNMYARKIAAQWRRIERHIEYTKER
jgi:hypothetical protein